MIKETRSKKSFFAAIVLSLMAIFSSFFISALMPMAKYKFLSDDALSFKVLATIAATYDATIIAFNSLATAFDGTSSDHSENLPRIELTVEQGSIQEMASNLPTSAKRKYYKARLVYPDGQIHNVKYRFRGRSFYHWDPEKPSLRIKTSKKYPFEGLRHFNLINPEDRSMTSNYYGEYLADKMGILTHNTKFVELFINQKYIGVYHLTTNDDEEMLRVNDRVPGPIYVGDDLAERWEADQFVVKGDLKVHKNLSPLQLMLDAIYAENTADKHEQLWDIVSKEQYAKFNALLSLVGGIHTDYTHNHLYYFDPSQGRIEPIISDINGHGLLLYPSPRERLTSSYEPFVEVPLNGRNNPLLDVALRDPDFRHLRNKFLYEYLTKEGSFEVQKMELTRLFDRIDPSVLKDRNKASIMETFVGYWRVPYSNALYAKSKTVVFDWIQQRNKFLLDELLNSKVTFDLRSMPSGATVLDVMVEGNSAVIFDVSVLGVKTSVRSRNAGNDELTGRNILHAGLAEKEVTWEPGRKIYEYQLGAGSRQYSFEIQTKMNLESLISALRSAFHNAVTGEDIVPALKRDVNRIKQTNVDLGRWVISSPSKTLHVMGPGQVILTSDLKIEANEELIVQPGSTILMAEGVSIMSKGRVTFDGEPDRPIAVKQLNKDKAWGVITIHGPSSNGSLIKHSTFSGGSNAFLENRMFSGMLSVSWTEDFLMQNATVQNNVLSDDTLHVVHSSFNIHDVSFKNCFGDCIDFDYSKGTISNIRITDAQNDGVDFMRSDVVASQIEVLGAGDKGFSVGEMSHVRIDKSRIQASEIGVAAKDLSVVEIDNSAFIQNNLAVSVYSKNWRFGGPGKVVIKSAEFMKNAVDIDIEENAEVHVYINVDVNVTTGDGSFSHVLQ
ncbi:CotH kinase family protein [Alphaproteobacteria bacterium]|nr:CotH kinase family protein [Alphaproteobacteria bacterium]